MADKLEKTRTPGVYRRGKSYVVVYRHEGKQRKKCVRTYVEARTVHGKLASSVADGTHREVSRLTFEDYARQWIDTYTGRTSRGFRDSTRKGYRFSIEQRAVPFFDGWLLAEIDAPLVKGFIASLFERKVSGRSPAVSTVRGHVAALKALLATAVEDGKITHNPASGVRIARAGDPVVEPDAAELRRALDSDELARFLDACPDQWRLFFRLLAMSGVRIGEAVELRWSDVDFGAKRLRVRRRFYHGTVAPPKSDNGRRDVPLSTVLARELWAEQGKPDELLFTSLRGQRLDRDWLWKNVLKPTAKAAGVPWAGFHTFRHTCASILFKSVEEGGGGKNPKQVQMWLGHSDPGFTLRTYVHLIDDGLGDADFLDTRLPHTGDEEWATPWATRATSKQANGAPAKARETA